MKNIFLIISICFCASCISQKKELSYSDEISKHWVSITSYKNEQVILNPCDAENESIQIEKNTENNYVLVISGGQDFVKLPIHNITKKDNIYIFHCTDEATENKEVTYSLEIIDASKGIASFENSPYVNIEHKKDFKEIDQPCAECWDDCEQ